jgi:hypothetical protein
MTRRGNTLRYLADGVAALAGFGRLLGEVEPECLGLDRLASNLRAAAVQADRGTGGALARIPRGQAS